MSFNGKFFVVFALIGYFSTTTGMLQGGAFPTNSELLQMVKQINMTLQSNNNKNSDLMKENSDLRHKISNLTKEVAAIKGSTQNKTKALERENSELQQIILNLTRDVTAMKASHQLHMPVAFTVALSSKTKLGAHQIIEFDHVVTNIGANYGNGIFTASVRGLYMFSCTVFTDPNEEAGVEMVKNGIELTRAHSDGTSWDSGATVALTHLDIGDRVWIRHGLGRPNDREELSGGLWSQFSGVLINAA